MTGWAAIATTTDLTTGEIRQTCMYCYQPWQDGHSCGDSAVVSFFVKGKPEPAGSKRAVSIPGRQFTQVIDANKHAAPWKKVVKDEAQYAMLKGQHRIVDGPCACRMDFVVRRPSGHFTTKGDLNAQGRRTPRPSVKPDVLKLARAVEDAMAGIVYTDDALICHEVLNKRYQTPGEQVGVQVYVWPLRHDVVREDSAGRVASPDGSPSGYGGAAA